MEKKLKLQERNGVLGFPINFPLISTKEQMKIYKASVGVFVELEGKRVIVGAIEICLIRLKTLERYKIEDLKILPKFRYRKHDIIKSVGTKIVENINSFLEERSRLLKKRGKTQVYGVLVDATSERGNIDEVVGFYRKHSWQPIHEDSPSYLFYFPEELSDENKELFNKIPD